MPGPQKEGVVYTYINERDGQIAAAAVKTSDWFEASQASEVLLQGAFAGGTTAVFVDQAHIRPASGNGEHTSADQLASLAVGAKVPLAYGWFRIRITQAAADTTNASLSAKLSD